MQFWPGRVLRRTGILADEWTRFDDGLLVEIDSRNIIHKLLLRDGRFAAPIYDQIINTLESDGVFVDVGANFGYFSLVAATRASEGRVLAVEADPNSARRLADHASRNEITNIEVFEVACWDVDCMLDLYVAATFNPGKTSLSAANAYSAHEVRVQAQPLDSIIDQSGVDRVDLIKVDIEGAELRALNGMERTIERFRPPVIVEAEEVLLERFDVSVADIHEFFDRHGYRGVPLTETDLLFTPVECGCRVVVGVRDQC